MKRFTNEGSWRIQRLLWFLPLWGFDSCSTVIPFCTFPSCQKISKQSVVLGKKLVHCEQSPEDGTKHFFTVLIHVIIQFRCPTMLHDKAEHLSLTKAIEKCIESGAPANSLKGRLCGCSAWQTTGLAWPLTQPPNPNGDDGTLKW